MILPPTFLTELTSIPPVDLEEWLVNISQLMPLLDFIPDAQFYVFDTKGMCIAANRYFVKHHGIKLATLKQDWRLDKSSIPYWPAFKRQDEQIIRNSTSIRDQLQLLMDSKQMPSWNITHKTAIQDRNGKFIGAACLAMKLQPPNIADQNFQKVKLIHDHISNHYNNEILDSVLAEISTLTSAHLKKECKRIYNLTPKQIQLKIRFDKVLSLLRAGLEPQDVAKTLEFSSFESFSRQCKALTGYTPADLKHILK